MPPELWRQITMVTDAELTRFFTRSVNSQTREDDLYTNLSRHNVCDVMTAVQTVHVAMVTSSSHLNPLMFHGRSLRKQNLKKCKG